MLLSRAKSQGQAKSCNFPKREEELSLGVGSESLYKEKRGMADGRSPRPAGLGSHGALGGVGAPADRLIANCTFQGPNVGGSFLLPQPSGLVCPGVWVGL